jgi:hypothetical protein
MSDTEPTQKEDAPEEEEEDTGKTTLRINDLPYVDRLVVGDVTVTTDPEGVEVDSSVLQDVYDAAAEARVRIEEVSTE